MHPTTSPRNPTTTTTTTASSSATTTAATAAATAPPPRVPSVSRNGMTMMTSSSSTSSSSFLPSPTAFYHRRNHHHQNHHPTSPNNNNNNNDNNNHATSTTSSYSSPTTTTTTVMPCLNPSSEINSRLDTQVEVRVYPCNNNNNNTNNNNNNTTKKKFTQFHVKPEGVIIQGTNISRNNHHRNNNNNNSSSSSPLDLGYEYSLHIGRKLQRYELSDTRACQLLVTTHDKSYWVVPAPEAFSRHSGTCRLLGDRKHSPHSHTLRVGDFLRVGSVGVVVIETHNGKEHEILSEEKIQKIMRDTTNTNNSMSSPTAATATNDTMIMGNPFLEGGGGGGGGGMYSLENEDEEEEEEDYYLIETEGEENSDDSSHGQVNNNDDDDDNLTSPMSGSARNTNKNRPRSTTTTTTTPRPPSKKMMKKKKMKTNQDLPTCYMCFDEEDTPTNPMITPCKCLGDTRYVHVECLRKWHTAEADDNPICFLSSVDATCSVCKTTFRSDFQLKDGRYVKLFKSSLEPPYLSLLVATKHEMASRLFNSRFQLSFSTLLKSDGKNGTRPLLLGRSSGSDMVLDYRTVSARHATIRYKNGEFVFVDAGSSNGSYLYLRKPVELVSGTPVQFRLGRSMISMRVVNKWNRRFLRAVSRRAMGLGSAPSSTSPSSLLYGSPSYNVAHRGGTTTGVGGGGLNGEVDTRSVGSNEEDVRIITSSTTTVPSTDATTTTTTITRTKPCRTREYIMENLPPIGTLSQASPQHLDLLYALAYPCKQVHVSSSSTNSSSNRGGIAAAAAAAATSSSSIACEKEEQLLLERGGGDGRSSSQRRSGGSAISGSSIDAVVVDTTTPSSSSAFAAANASRLSNPSGACRGEEEEYDDEEEKEVDDDDVVMEEDILPEYNGLNLKDDDDDKEDEEENKEMIIRPTIIVSGDVEVKKQAQSSSSPSLFQQELPSHPPLPPDGVDLSPGSTTSVIGDVDIAIEEEVAIITGKS